MRRYVVVRASWDDEAQVWYVSDSDIAGLATEAATLDDLRRKVPILIQDLLQDDPAKPEEIELDLIAYAHGRFRLAA